jgi:class 3 adenylate cyclase/CHASE2 domain-containing sensor protein
MKKIGKKYHKNLSALVIIFALSGALIAGHLAGLFNFIEYKLYDPRINVFANRSMKSQDIILVLVDQESIEWGHQERGWGWPWPREAYAELVDYMNLGQAKSVVFDILFSEPSIYRNARQDAIIEDVLRTRDMTRTASAGGELQAALRLSMEAFDRVEELRGRQDDASLAEAAKRYGKVVQGVNFSSQTGDVYTWPSDLNKSLFKTENFGSAISKFDIVNDYSPDEAVKVRAQIPIEELRNTAAAVGAFTGRADSDGIIRRYRLFTVFDGKAVPSLAAAPLLASGYENTISYDAKKKLIRWGEFNIPVDEEGKTLLRFRGDPITRYPRYSLAYVLQNADYMAGRTDEEPEEYLPPETVTGAYVFVGVYAPGLFDIFPSPIAATYPGMGVHVSMRDNLLMGDFITKAPDWTAAIIIAGAVILMVVLVLYSGRISVTVGGLVVSFAAIIFAGFWAFHLNWWIPMAAPIFATLLAYLTSTLYSYATEGKDKLFIKNAFSRILSPKVIDQIIADPSQLKLGGEKRKMTAIFTDIQRFSSISSELQDQYGENGPKALVNLLNLYLTEMSNVVLENGGTIDKYEGDAIIGFFGAPAWMEDHAARACRSAILMKRRETEIVENVMKPGGEFFNPLNRLIEIKVLRKLRPLYTRLGINTGDMVVGFMGTPAKMDYTIMGNAVNLAARLEGVNKQYDTHGILISEYTKEQIGDEFVVRPLSRVTVVGIPVPLRLFELLEIKSDASQPMLDMVKAWEKAFDAYENRNFSSAKKTFTEIYSKDDEDTTAKLYVERCEKYIASPPPKEWDGVDYLTEK